MIVLDVSILVLAAAVVVQTGWLVAREVRITRHERGTAPDRTTRKPWRAPKSGGYQAVPTGRPKTPPPTGRGAGSPPLRPDPALVKPDPNSSHRSHQRLLTAIDKTLRGDK